MRYWHATFEGIYLTGDAIIAARSREKALELLSAKLLEAGLTQKTPPALDDIRELNLAQSVAVIIDNGDY